MNKKVFITLLISLLLLSISTLVFATDNNMAQDAINGVRNVVQGTENTVENAAKDDSNTSQNVTNQMNKVVMKW